MNAGKLVIETELKNNKLDHELAKLQRNFDAAAKQSDVLANRIERLQNSLNSPRLSDNKIAQITSQIETTKLQLGKTIDRQDYYNEKIDETKLKMQELQAKTQQANNETNKLGTTNSKVFEKGVKTLKRFALGIVAIRSAYTMARKAASAYMAQDEELSNKVKSFWIGLGSFLAPILEMLSTAMLKALGYLNVFIKALTGIDYIARANAKALKKQADATKQATNALSSLDEIENIDLGSKKDEKSLADFGSIDIPELDPKIVKKLEDMAKWLKENWDWIQKVGEALALVFVGKKLKDVLGGIGKIIGSKSAGKGLAGMKGLLTALAVAWTISVVIEGLQALDELRKAYKKLNEAQINRYTKESRKQSDIIARTNDLIKSNKLTKESYAQLAEEATESIKQNEALIKSGNLNEEQNLALSKSNEDLRNYMAMLRRDGYLTEDMWKEYSNRIELTGVEYSQLAEMSNLTEDELNGIKTAVKNGQIALDNITNKDYRIQIKTDMDNTAINKLIETIDALEEASKSGSWVTKSVNKGQLSVAKFMLKKIRGYAHGGLITQPTQALIGEAGYNEYIVPEKSNYLSRLASNIIDNMPAGGLSDDLLLELNRNITELASRPIVINVDGKALAQATYQDFKNEENRLNSSTSVSVK